MAFVAIFAPAACSGPIVITEGGEVDDPEGIEKSVGYGASGGGSLLGEGGIVGLFTNDDKPVGGGIGVNAFLWRASLDTLSFMPLVSADPFGGVILTDWRTSVDFPDERYKMNVFILGGKLRSDALRVTVLKQNLVEGIWRDAPPSEKTNMKIEDAILSAARRLRAASYQGQ